MFRRLWSGKAKKSTATGSGREPRRSAKRDRTRHFQFETLEDRYLLSGVPTPLGAQFEVNPSVPIDGGSNGGVVASNAAGDTVVLWEYGFYGIYAQRFTSAGVAQGSDFKVAPMSQGVNPSLSVAMDSAGDFVVAWQSGNSGSAYGIYAQLVSAANVDVGSPFAVDPLASTAQSFDTQTGPSVAMDAAGDFVIAWQSPYAGGGSGIYAQRYNAAGNAQGSQFRVGDASAPGNYPAVAMDSAGDFVVTWSGVANGTSGISAQLYQADGTAQGSEFQVNTYSAGISLSQSVAMDSAGDFVITWTNIGEDGSAGGIYGQRYASTGSAQGSEFQVNSYTTGDQNYAGVAMDSAGDFVVTWQSTGTLGMGDGDFAQVYTADGNASGSEFQVNTYTTSFELAPRVAMDGVGDFLVTWANEGVPFGAVDGRAYSGNFAASAVGSDFQVNTYTVGGRANPKVASDSAGDYVVVWQNQGKDGSGYGIYAQRYASTGSAQGSEFQVNTYTTGDQDQPDVAMDSAGDFVVIWQSYGQNGTGSSIFAQRYSSAGATQGSEFQANTYSGHEEDWPAAVAMDSAGDFIVAWDSYNPALNTAESKSIFVQRYNASGVGQGTAFQVPAAPYGLGMQYELAAAMDSAGDFVIAWDQLGGSDLFNGICAELFNAAGVAQGSGFNVNTETLGIHMFPTVAMDAAGDFVVAWNTFGDGSPSGMINARTIYAQRYNSTGVAQGSEFQVNSYTAGDEEQPSAAMDSAGDFVITWFGNDADGTYAIRGQAYAASGAAQGSEFQANTAAGDLDAPLVAVAMDSTGDFVVAWQNNRDESGYGVYAQRYTLPTPTAAGPELQVNTYTTGNQNTPKVAMDAAGDSVIVWQSLGQNGSGYGVYGQRYNAAGVAQGSEFRVDAGMIDLSGKMANPEVAMDAAGDFVVVWESYGQNASGYGIFAQRYNSAGVAQGGAFAVATSNVGTAFVNPAVVAMDAEGDFVVAWDSFQNSTYLLASTAVVAQRYNAAGIAQGSSFFVNSEVEIPDAISVAMDSAGDFVLAWQSLDQTGAYQVHAQRYDAAGVAEGSEFRVNSASMPYQTQWHMNPSVAMDAVGDFVIDWTARPPGGDSSTITAQLYNAAGVAQGSQFVINSAAGATRYQAPVAMDSAGDFVISWSDYSDIYAQRYDLAGHALGDEFKVNAATTGDQRLPAVAMDSAGDFTIAWQSKGQDGSGYGIFAQRYTYSGAAPTGPFTFQGTTLTINGATLVAPLELEFTSPTAFNITFNGTTYFYNTSTISHVIFNGTPGTFSEVIYYDSLSTDDYTAAQSLSSTTLTRTDGIDFEFDANRVSNFYAYVAGSTSTATVNVSIGSGSNFYVSAADGGYSYIADPVKDIYSELSGFGSETVTGSGGSTYAYVYSASNATFVGDPSGSTLTVGGGTSTFSGFTQLYAVGADDGTDAITLQTAGGSFVDTPGFAYVAGTLNSAPFLIGALFAANVTGQASNPTDSAFFYNYPGDTFDGGVGTSTLTGATGGLTSFANFMAQAAGFQAVIDEESGSGTDAANLNSPGNATFTSTPTSSTLVVDGVTVLTIMTSVNSGGTFIPVPGQVTVTGVGVTSDVANLYDESGTNAIVAQGNTATLNRPSNSVSVSQFGQVNALQTEGSIDDLDPVNIDFALQTVGNWTSD